MAFLAAISAISSAASGIIGFAGAQQAGAQQEAAGHYQAAIAANQAEVDLANAERAVENAKTAYTNAGRVGYAGQLAAQDQDIEAAAQIGDYKAAFGASGLAGGSHGDVLASLQFLADRDRFRLASEGSAKAGQVRTQANQFEVQGADFRSSATAAIEDSAMLKANAKLESAQTRLAGFGSLIQGFSGATGSILSSAQNPLVASQFSGAKAWFKNKYGRAIS